MSSEELARHDTPMVLHPVTLETEVDTEHCPWCESVISRARFQQIQSRISEQERQKLAQERQRIQQELRAEKDAFEARIKQESQERIAAATAERDALEANLKAAQEREAETRQQAVAEAVAKTRADVEERLARLATERAEAAAQLELQTSKHQEELAHQRAVFEEDRDAKLRQQAAEHGGERDKWQKKVEDLNRQLQHKTPNELGDGAEVDIYQALRDSFVGDDITRIKKGQPGADIRHTVLHKGAECGTIVIDSKNRQAWRHDYVTKLREDQITDKAEHAVLATNVFTTGKKDLYVDEETGVVVVSRARAVDVVGILRDALLRMHRLGLSLEQRAEKRDLLYTYLTSEEYRQHVAEASRLTQEMGELDTKELKSHNKVWAERGRMNAQLRNALRSIDSQVGAIIERKADDTTEEEPAR